MIHATDVLPADRQTEQLMGPYFRDWCQLVLMIKSIRVNIELGYGMHELS